MDYSPLRFYGPKGLTIHGFIYFLINSKLMNKSSLCDSSDYNIRIINSLLNIEYGSNQILHMNNVIRVGISLYMHIDNP